MQFWDTVITTAMMGTDKKQVSANEIPEGELATAAAIIYANAAKDKEEKFLQLAAVISNYRQCGGMPVQKEIPMNVSPAEENSYCSVTASQVLNDILDEESIPLIKFWLQHCYERQLIVQPAHVPVLLQTGAQQKKLQLMIASCCGKRGEWLGSFNSAWNFSSTQTGEELWQTGTFEQRKEILKLVRDSDPAKAMDWVQQTWVQEDANTKTALLEILSENLSGVDIAFLESLASEKSKKIKEIAIKLLKKIPGSAIVLMYEKLLEESVTIKKEKSLLGMLKKTALQFKIPESIDEAIYKSGIDKLSNKKELTDDEYIISQLVKSVPPSFWEKHLDMDPEQIIGLFQKDTTGNKMIPELINAIVGFKDKRWAVYFMQYSPVFYIDIIPLLPAKQLDVYSYKFFNDYPDQIIQYATAGEMEWSLELTKNIFRHTAKNHYQYNRSFYNQHIHLVPVNVITELDKCNPSEEYLRNIWTNTSGYIVKLISLKIRTTKAFNT